MPIRDHDLSGLGLMDVPDSPLDLADDMLKEFAGRGKEVSPETLQGAWKTVAASERIIMDNLPNSEGLTEQLDKVTTEVDAEEQSHAEVRRQKRATIARLNQAKASLKAKLMAGEPTIDLDDNGNVEAVMKLLKDQRDKLVETKKLLAAQREILEQC